jgi:hypothetical protein
MPPRHVSSNNKDVPLVMQPLLEAQTHFLQMMMQHVNNNNPNNNNPPPQGSMRNKF